MPRTKIKRCGLKGCIGELDPGAIVAISFGDLQVETTVCDYHGELIRSLQPGTFRITPELELKNVPAIPAPRTRGKK